MRHLRPTIALAALALAAGAAEAAAATGLALAVGTSERPSATWRLEGDRFTARFARPLVRRGAPVRVAIHCGDLAIPPDEHASYVHGALADRGSRRLRIRAGTRVIRARLDRDVAASTTWCEITWERGLDVFGDEHAAMRLRRGTRPGCRPSRRERVLMQTERVLVTSLWDPDVVTAHRACVKPDGRLQPLVASFDGGGGGGASLVLDPWAIGGTWVAWGAYVSPHDGSWGSLEMQARDVAGTGRTAEFAAAPGGAPPGSDVHALAVAPNGTVAWVLRVGEQADQLNVRRVGGTVTTVATGPMRSLSDLAISADGTTVTWREHGVERSVQMP